MKTILATILLAVLPFTVQAKTPCEQQEELIFHMAQSRDLGSADRQKANQIMVRHGMPPHLAVKISQIVYVDLKEVPPYQLSKYWYEMCNQPR